jgi:hypothetical protein
MDFHRRYAISKSTNDGENGDEWPSREFASEASEVGPCRLGLEIWFDDRKEERNVIG